MDVEAEVRRFLSACRARLSPEQAGVPAFDGARRVPGLRREEVAHLAGVSVDYYTRLERGRLTGASDGVLDAVARALKLDDVEREHLFHLARSLSGGPLPAAPRRGQRHVRREIGRVLNSITVPAFVQNPRLDVLAANDLGWAVYRDASERPPVPFNHLEFQFLNPRARCFYREWDAIVRNTIAVLRAAAAREPCDAALDSLIADVSAQSEEFRRLWLSTHEVRRYRNGAIRVLHPDVGDLDFTFEAFELAADPGLTLVAYIPAPCTPTADALGRLV